MARTLYIVVGGMIAADFFGWATEEGLHHFGVYVILYLTFGIAEKVMQIHGSMNVLEHRTKILDPELGRPPEY